MLNFPNWIVDCDSHNPVLLDLFPSDTTICFTMAFSPFESSNHVVLSVCNYFPSNSKGDALFHCITYGWW